MSTTALLGTDGPWPLAGHLHGALLDGELRVSWAGRVASHDPQAGWRASRSLDRALRRGAVRPGTIDVRSR